MKPAEVYRINWGAPLGFGPRCRKWRPPDPVWAPREALNKVRGAINHHFDNRLDVWWIEERCEDDMRQPGRWAVMYWKERAQEWSVVFYWETAAGEFRNIGLDCITVFTNMLHECDNAKPSNDLKDVRRKHEEAQAVAQEKRIAANKDARRRYSEDHLARDVGIRQTFAPGYIRRRQVKKSDLKDTNHERWRKEIGVK